jgi:putative PIN family toxin of toxin-antitoxin system
MGSPIVTLRVVFDTNTVISALLFSEGQLAWLRTVWRQGTIVPLISKATTEEIVRVLGYPKFHLDAADQEELLGDFLPFAEIIEAVLPTGAAPICRDKHDQIFLELAVTSKADALVTGDADLLVLAEQSPISIMTPADFHRHIGIK